MATTLYLVPSRPTLLHWMKRGLSDLPELDFPQDGTYEVVLSEPDAPKVRAVR